MQAQDHRAEFRNQRWIECQNVGGIALPAFSVAQVVESERPEKASALTPGGGRTVIQVQEAQCDSPRNTVVIGPMDIPVGETRICTNDFPTFARYSGQPQPGEHWGVAEDAIVLTKNQVGFIIIGDAENGIVRVRRAPWTTPLFKAKALTCFNPDSHGGSGIFDIYVYEANPNDIFPQVYPPGSPADWILHASGVTVHDSEFRVSMLPDEFHWVALFADPDCSEHWEFIGEHGLSRTGKASGDIACNQSGSVVIWQDTNASCGSQASNCTITACNDWGYTRKIKSGEKVHIRFYERSWRVIQTARPQIAYAFLIGALCPTSLGAAAISGFTTRDWCTDEDPNSALNQYGLSGLPGSQVELHYDRTLDAWIIVQVLHQCYNIAADDCGSEDYLRYVNCQIQTKSLVQVSIMTCDEDGPEWVTDITLVSRTMLKEITCTAGTDASGASNITCPTVSYTPTTVCLFDADDAQQSSNCLTFEYIDVLVDITDDGECLIATYQAICVAAVDEDTATEEILCTTDCPSGSGSGSGSGS